jgi:hypothetical protein
MTLLNSYIKALLDRTTCSPLDVSIVEDNAATMAVYRTSSSLKLSRAQTWYCSRQPQAESRWGDSLSRADSDSLLGVPLRRSSQDFQTNWTNAGVTTPRPALHSARGADDSSLPLMAPQRAAVSKFPSKSRGASRARAFSGRGSSRKSQSHGSLSDGNDRFHDITTRKDVRIKPVKGDPGHAGRNMRDILGSMAPPNMPSRSSFSKKPSMRRIPTPVTALSFTAIDSSSQSTMRISQTQLPERDGSLNAENDFKWPSNRLKPRDSQNQKLMSEIHVPKNPPEFPKCLRELPYESSQGTPLFEG